MKKIRSVVHIASWILSSVVFLTAIALIAAFVCGYRMYCIQTGSMEPDYTVGTIIFVKPVDFNSLSEGDVITFRSGSVVVTHRIVSIDRDSEKVETKGDNNDTADFSPTDYSDIIGRVEYYVPYVGYPVLFGQTLAGKIIIVNVFLLFILAVNVIRYLEEDDEEDKVSTV